MQNFTLKLGQRVTNSIKFGIQHVLDFAKFSYLALVPILLLFAVFEIKRIFTIDIFPGIDTPIDKAQYKGKYQLELIEL
ncbi:MAG: hypothetical protein K9H61_00630 [Bacteroidia bacterium]|nr:hypothetical protein [Bacteroidia bacterium]MCF8426265.1 hypothetical protein [Bacteroidia bacterium]MCF8445470.1 hypothetical protein [Bacteroidia bacterium]